MCNEKSIDIERITELYQYTISVVNEAVSIVLNHVQQKKFISTYYEFPKRSSDFPNEMPSFSTYFFTEGPLDYANVFSSSTNQKDKIVYSTLDSYQGIKEFLVKNVDIASAMGILSEDKISDFYLGRYIGKLTDRYLHISKENKFDETVFLPIFSEISSLFFNKTLNLSIGIPILMVKFSNEFLSLGDKYEIRKMSDDFQLARIDIHSYGSGVHKTVIGCATHMLMLKEYHIKNEGYKKSLNSIYEASSYPLDLIDRFFACLRIVSDIKTGYSQLLTIPYNWASEYKANLPPVYGTSIRAYPQYFDNYVWLSDAAVISDEQVRDLNDVFNLLTNNDHKKIQIAVKRFNSCDLRSDIDDSILDAIIALEILLSDDDKGELTYKISSRLAAIMAIGKHTEYKPNEVSKSMAKIYRYRSDIVHGREVKSSTEQIQINNQPIPTIKLATDFLRKTITTLLRNPKYLIAKNIDAFIMESLSSVEIDE